MLFEWTAHRFSGGLLALDLVNTVVCRGQPERRVDRFTDDVTIKQFCEAAGRLGQKEMAGGLSFDPVDAPSILELREAINGWLRPVAKGGKASGSAIERLFSAAASCMQGQDEKDGYMAFGPAAAVSAMRLFGSDLERKVKICPNCDWLFVDRSKNQSRVWCDMRVCGNRTKASNHYQRHRIKAKAAMESVS